MVDSSGGLARAPTSDFVIRLKGWRSQLRWAMTQREDDPARVWLEIISLDERSKRALSETHDPEQLTELERFRERLESSMTSLIDQLGDDNVAPLYSWLDLVRQRRAAIAHIEQAWAAVAQIRAARGPGAPKPPVSDEEATEQLARAQADLEQWQRATPPEPRPEVRAVWASAGGAALEVSMDRDPIAVAKRGDAARPLLARVKGRTPGTMPWVGSRAELVTVPVLGVVAVVATLAVLFGSTGLAPVAWLATLGTAALVGLGAFARRRQRLEREAALAWTWHRMLYDEKTKLAELEAGWLRALVDSQRKLRTFDAKAGAGGQLQDFEAWRPDLAEMVLEVARDTEAST